MKSSVFQIPLLALGAHGGTRVLVDFANRAAAKGASVRILVPRGGKAKAYAFHPGVSLREIGPGGLPKALRALFFLCVLPFYLRRGTLVANFFPTVFPIWIASFLFRRPVVYFVQDIETWFSGPLGALLNAACRVTWRSKRIVATSASVAASLEARGVGVWRRVSIGVSDSFFEASDAEPEKAFDLVCFPRREAWKRMDRIEAVMTAARKRGRALRVLALGQDQAMLERARSFGAEARKPLDEAELIRWVQSARALLFASEREGLGLPPLEAMALGVPCVCFESDGVRTYLRDGENGFLVKDVEAAVRQIFRLLDEPALKARLQEEGKKTAQTFSTSAAFDRLLEEAL